MTDLNAEIERRLDEAHKALDACARNLGNGANTDGASHEFKLIVPTEVKLVVEGLERRAQAAEADCAALREVWAECINELGFIAQGGNTATSAEALCQAYERRARRIIAGISAALAAMTPGATITREDA